MTVQVIVICDSISACPSVFLYNFCALILRCTPFSNGTYKSSGQWAKTEIRTAAEPLTRGATGHARSCRKSSTEILPFCATSHPRPDKQRRLVPKIEYSISWRVLVCCRVDSISGRLGLAQALESNQLRSRNRCAPFSAKAREES